MGLGLCVLAVLPPLGSPILLGLGSLVVPGFGPQDIHSCAASARIQPMSVLWMAADVAMQTQGRPVGLGWGVAYPRGGWVSGGHFPRGGGCEAYKRAHANKQARYNPGPKSI